MATEYHLLLGLTTEGIPTGATGPGTGQYFLLLALTTEQGGVTPPPPTVVQEGTPGGTLWYEVVGTVTPSRPPGLKTRRGW